MIAAGAPTPRRAGARLLVVAGGRIEHASRSRLIDFLYPGDLLIANDAATIPASLSGVHRASGEVIEVRLAGRRSLAYDDVRDFVAITFGAGDHRTLTENRLTPPVLRAGDVLKLGPLRARVNSILHQPRLVTIGFEGRANLVWRGIALHGRPIQYAHVPERLELWDAWTRIAARPVAFEPPSASFVLDWALVQRLRASGVGFATLAHAAGISSTGDPALDAQLPFDEPYELPMATVEAIGLARARGGRIVALGTTVTRALEHSASDRNGLRPGERLATQRIGPETELRVVDAIISGTHEAGESHYELLKAFADDTLLTEMSRSLDLHRYRSHEFGDSVLIERQERVNSPKRRGRGAPWSEPGSHVRSNAV